VVRAFARRGASIGLIARGPDGLNAAAEEVDDLGGQALVIPADVADPHQVEAAADAVERQLGPIDVWINNAMVSVFSPAMDMTPEEFQRVTEVTYLGYVYGTLAALKRMRPRDRGVIVQVGSALAYRGIPLQSAYCGAKHAVQGFTESVRCELLHEGSNVKITMVQLPALNTPQFSWVKSRLPRKPQPVPPIYQPEVAADAIVWAAHHYRRQWYVGGSTLRAIMADKIVPGLADRYLARYGYDAQQYDGPAEQGRPNNLYEPLAGDHGAHGDFDDRASARNLLLWLSQHRRWLFLGAAVLAGWRFRAASSPE
jgi:NAD(P)-dependent dehydrogenase (short-subunit alcohol dehydrogenase family)